MLVVLCETREDVSQSIKRIWTCATFEQVLPHMKKGTATRAGIAMVTRPEGEYQIMRRIDFVSEDGKGMVHATSVRIGNSSCATGIYVGPQTRGEKLYEVMEELKRTNSTRSIIFGRHERQT